MTIDRASTSGRVLVLVDRLNQLRAFLAAPTISEPDEVTFRKTFHELRAAVAELAEALDEREQVSTFAEFFSNVGDSLVRAQRALDVHTQTYLQEVTGHPTMLPAVFRIPSLTADIRFALERVSQDRLNMIIHSKGSEARELNQQSIHFEIIAAPPPPAALEGEGLGPWRPTFVLSPSARESTLAAMRIAANTAEVTSSEQKALLGDVLSNPDAILIVESGEEGKYFLALALGDDPKNVGVWVLTVRPPTIQPAYRYTRAPAAGELEGMRDLHRRLGAACTAQQELMRRIRGQPA